MELHVRHLSLEQRAQGHDVTLLFNQGRPEHAQDRPILESLNLRKLRPQFLRDIVFYVTALAHLLRHRAQYDVLHIHGDWSAFLFGVLIARLLPTRIRVASIHDVVRTGWRGRLSRRVLRSYDVVYCTGAKEAGQLRNMGLQQTRWQPSGVATEFSSGRISTEAPSLTVDIICVANLVPKKNIELLIRVAQQLPSASFLVVGDGPLKNRLQATCSDGNIHNVAFCGKLDRTSLALRMVAAKVFYLPSLAEGTPTAMMEAMTLGLPVVTTPSNDYQELIRQGENGFVTEDFSVDSSVRALLILLTNPDRMQKISRTNAEFSSRLAWNIVAKRISDWMAEAAAAKMQQPQSPCIANDNK